MNNVNIVEQNGFQTIEWDMWEVMEVDGKYKILQGDDVVAEGLTDVVAKSIVNTHNNFVEELISLI